MAFKGSPSTSTQVVKNEIPEWINKAGQDNYKEAVRIGEKPLQQFPGSTVAPMSGTTKQAIDYFKGELPGMGEDFNEASDIFSMMSDPGRMGSAVTGYLNPYIDEVENKALGALDRSRQLSLMQNADKAIQSKAFGGSRSAIVDAVTNSEAANNAGLLSSTLRKEGFDTAGRNLRSDLTSAGQGLIATGESKSSNVYKNLASLLQMGGTEQNQSQRELDSQVDKFLEARDKDITDLNLRLSTLGMTPYPTSSTTKTTSTQGTAPMDIGALLLGMLTLGAGFI